MRRHSHITRTASGLRGRIAYIRPAASFRRFFNAFSSVEKDKIRVGVNTRIFARRVNFKTAKIFSHFEKYRRLVDYSRKQEKTYRCHFPCYASPMLPVRSGGRPLPTLSNANAAAPITAPHCPDALCVRVLTPVGVLCSQFNFASICLHFRRERGCVSEKIASCKQNSN